MKKIVFALAALAIISCKKEEVKPVDYTLFTGTITKPNSDKLTIYQGRKPVKEVSVDENGKFADTLRLDEGDYVIYDGAESATIYVKKGSHFNMTLDTNEFDETLSFTGEGASPNNYFAAQTMLNEELDWDALVSGDQANLDAGYETFKKKYLDLLSNAKGLDSTTKAQQTKNIEGLKVQLSKMFATKAKFNAMKGQPSIAFNYDNVKGGKTSLADLKGKYVYIDVWATWCGPCKKEIPFLKEVEKAYHEKNIEFVSISVDAERAHKGSMEKAVEAWKKMVADKELGGIQLHFGGDQEFSKAYEISGIPRFILLDPTGNIVDADAPRPSSPKLKELFAAQGI